MFLIQMGTLEVEGVEIGRLIEDQIKLNKGSIVAIRVKVRLRI